MLNGFIDVAHANDLHRRSLITGLFFTFCGGAVFWRSKTQSLTAGSSTEADLFVAYEVGNVCEFLHMVIKQLGHKQPTTTSIYINNMLALQMINENTVPTETVNMLTFVNSHFKIMCGIIRVSLCIIMQMLSTYRMI